jgi:hypothetical protein
MKLHRLPLFKVTPIAFPRKWERLAPGKYIKVDGDPHFWEIQLGRGRWYWYIWKGPCPYTDFLKPTTLFFTWRNYSIWKGTY